MTTYAVTINPFPFYKWNKENVSSFLDMRIICANYSKLPSSIQKQMLDRIIAILTNSTNNIFDWSSPAYEKTKSDNLHVHLYFTMKDTKDNLELPKDFYDACIRINDLFGLPNVFNSYQSAIHVEKTKKDIMYWQQYMKKEERINKCYRVLGEIQYPPHDFE